MTQRSGIDGQSRDYSHPSGGRVGSFGKGILACLLWSGAAIGLRAEPTTLLVLKQGMTWTYLEEASCGGECGPPYDGTDGPNMALRTRKKIFLTSLTQRTDSTLLNFNVNDSGYYPNRPSNPRKGFDTTYTVECLSHGGRIKCPYSTLGNYFFQTAVDEAAFINRPSTANPPDTAQELLLRGVDTVYYKNVQSTVPWSGNDKIYFKSGVGLVKRHTQQANHLNATDISIDLLAFGGNPFDMDGFLKNFAAAYALGVRPSTIRGRMDKEGIWRFGSELDVRSGSRYYLIDGRAWRMPNR